MRTGIFSLILPTGKIRNFSVVITIHFHFNIPSGLILCFIRHGGWCVCFEIRFRYRFDWWWWWWWWLLMLAS